MKHLLLVLVACVTTHTALALEVTIRDAKGFVVIEQKDGMTLIGSSAIRKSDISSVSLTRIGTKYKLVVVTAIRVSGPESSVLKQYETYPGSREDIEKAFNEIVKLLAMT
jgi:hypothetical protein